jgi:hypothetical protein
LKEKIGKFMERKERNSYVLQNFHKKSGVKHHKSIKKVYISNVIIFKNEKVFSKIIFLKQVKEYS